MNKEFQDVPEHITAETCMNGKDKGRVFLNISGKRFALSDFEFVLSSSEPKEEQNT